MSETAAAATSIESNGVPAATIVVAEIPDDVKENIDRGIAAMSPEKRQKAIAELEAMLAATRGAADKADVEEHRGQRGVASAPVAASTAAASAATSTTASDPAAVAAVAAPAATTPTAAAVAKHPSISIDPYPDPPHMVESKEIAYLWSQEAIEKSAYLVPIDAWKRAHPTLDVEDFRYLVVGDMIKRFRPLDGYLLEADGGGDSGMPVVFKWLAQQPLLVAAASGRIVESKGPTNVVVHACHSLHKLIPLLQFDGVIHGRLRPMGWHTALSGAREFMFQLWVEPDDADPRKPKLISLESALGKSTR